MPGVEPSSEAQKTPSRKKTGRRNKVHPVPEDLEAPQQHQEAELGQGIDPASVTTDRA